MNEHRKIRLSKFLSYALRHEPDAIGVRLDDAGWAEVAELLAGCADHDHDMTAEELTEIVRTSPKQRFAFNEDGTRIRANQGHSVDVDLGYERSPPPEFLYHGTVARVADAIERRGLLKMNRHHVHLSPDVETARVVGSRRGQPLIFRVAARSMQNEGYVFYRAENGVWLTDHVPPSHLVRLGRDGRPESEP